jgi:hypothetical protein
MAETPVHTTGGTFVAPGNDPPVPPRDHKGRTLGEVERLVQRVQSGSQLFGFAVTSLCLLADALSNCRKR